ncbi:unnamed protein product [Peronospora belbahrii]|uniref:Uncharacterized protein n=1 Tax=Peronospora belbahrii TaxID=622444 RepID=A0ABN8D1I7_9STRA|nr:unnamed protein product [Peronospora belbahrii]
MLCNILLVEWRCACEVTIAMHQLMTCHLLLRKYWVLRCQHTASSPANVADSLNTLIYHRIRKKAAS